MKLSKSQLLVMNEYNTGPDCVNEEVKLLERVWLSSGWDSTKSLYWNLQRMPHPESISRARRRLHELGLIKYSDEAMETRVDAYTKDVNRYSNYEKTKADIVNRQVSVEMVDGELITVIR